MPTVARIIGGAGTGKTTDLLNRMERALSAGGYSPYEVGFCSFTRAACQEAASRAARRFGLEAEALTRQGWFRTLHACCFQLVGVKSDQLLAGSRRDKGWLRDALQADVRGCALGDPRDELVSARTASDVSDGFSSAADTSEPFGGKTDAERVLALWSTARSRLVPLERVWEPARYCDERIPELAECEALVRRYEQAKRLDGRIDFVDLLGRYAGIAWTDGRGHFETAPQGEIPAVPIWFLDEQQDTSPLLDRVCRRLVSRSRWVYLCLDPFQAIYGWNGADARCAMAWEVQKQGVMLKTWRCPAPVQALGEAVLRGCSDYWDRRIEPADHAGEVVHCGYREASWLEQLCDEIRRPLVGRGPRVTHMLLARSNAHAARLGGRLDGMSVPWVPATGEFNRWTAPGRWETVLALRGAEAGGPVALGEWQRIVRSIPSAGNLERGTKARFERLEGERDAGVDADALRMTDDLGEWGATPELIARIRSGRWVELVEGAERFQEAVRVHGLAAVDRPRVMVGTVHSAKGMEAEHVYLLTTLSHQVQRGMETREGRDEELRVQYVGVTRAKRRLTLLEEPDARFRMSLPV